MACNNCSDGLHWECLKISDGACCCNSPSDIEEPPVAEEEDDDGPRYISRTYKREGTLKDQQSTGRKRAAKLYPLNSESPCEWRRLKFAGGGRYSIVGCMDGTQQARHHGPDKNTLNNDTGNVHRICHTCHNRWHTENDSVYTPDTIGNRHDPDTRATPEEIVANIAYWANRKLVKAKD